jgi:hypothetical protein
LEEELDGVDDEFEGSSHHGAREIDAKHKGDGWAVLVSEVFGAEGEEEGLFELLVKTEGGVGELAAKVDRVLTHDTDPMLLRGLLEIMAA